MSQAGLVRSTDAGQTWVVLPDSPALALVAWAYGVSLAGVTQDGAVWISVDAGVSWQAKAYLGARTRGIAAAGDLATGGRIVLVTDLGLIESVDTGDSFRSLAS